MSDFAMNVAIGEGIRRLPIYLLLDCSGSMDGPPIEAVRRGVEQFERELKADAYAAQTAHVAVITFDTDARMVSPGLAPATQFTAPQISAGGTTNLAKALQLLIQSLDRDLRKAGAGVEKGDWKPMVFVLTDGAPDPGWETPHQDLVRRQTGMSVNIVTVGCGTGINDAVLGQIGIGGVFRMDATDQSFKNFFKWVTQSVQAASKIVSSPQAAAAGQVANVAMPATPPGMVQFNF